jgi:GT2 family glycosyltransferase
MSPPELQAVSQFVPGQDKEYSALRARVQQAARQYIRADDIVLVVSRGDPVLLDLGGFEGWHFPRQADGRYAGYYPKRAISATAHLEALRARGAAFLLIPETSRWWLNHYPEFRVHLERRYECLLDDPGSCVIFAIRDPRSRATDPVSQLEQVLDENLPRIGDDPPILDWGTGLSLTSALPNRTVFMPPKESSTLPYLDRTIDVVAVRTKDREILREAARVASKVVVNLEPGNGHASETRWVRSKVSRNDRFPANVSIVIPCHGGIALAHSCLATLRETLPSWFRGEIIVVDSASSDGTATVLARLRQPDNRIRVIRSDSNRGFLEACNRGAQVARGDLLLFLKQGAVLIPGWLSRMLCVLAEFRDAGAVGGKLLSEDGSLREAGRLVFADGSTSEIGSFDPDVEAPLYQYVREVDSVSAGFLMTPRSLFHEVGGFDPRYRVGCYENDYCFSVRATGRHVYYQPESVMVCIEHTGARSDSPALKQYQVVDRKVFAEKWRMELARQPKRPESLDWRGSLESTGRVKAP